MVSEVPPALYPLLHSGDTDNIAQAVEILHALQLSNDTLTGLIQQLFRANHTARKVAGMSILGRFHTDLPHHLLTQARQIIQARLCGRSRPTIQRGITMLTALNVSEITVDLWRHIVDNPPRQSTWIRMNTIETLSAMVPPEATLPHTHLSHHALFGSRIQPSIPALLTHMPHLEEVDFKKCYRQFPAWFSQIPSIKRLDLRYTMVAPLHSSMLPPRLETLALSRSPTPAVSLSIPTLQSLNLRSCAGLNQLDLQGCLSLRHLDLSHCTALTELPTHLETLPALRTLNVSGCARLQDIPPALLQRTGLTVHTRGCLSLKRNVSKRRTLPALLRSKNIHDLHDAIRLWAAMPPAKQARHQPAMVTGLSSWLGSRDRTQMELAVEALDVAPIDGLMEALWGRSLMAPEGTFDALLVDAHQTNHRHVLLRELLVRLPSTTKAKLQHLHSKWLTDLHSLSDFPNLRMLILEQLPGELPDLSALTKLTQLSISRCNHLTRLPKPLPALTHVTLSMLPRISDRDGARQLRSSGVELLIRDYVTRRRLR